MNEISRRKIWQRALAILKKFGNEKHETASCYVKVSDRCSLALPEGQLEIDKYSNGQFHENMTLTVRIQKRVVFKADQSAWHEKVDPRRVLKIDRDHLVIEKFVSGKWIDLLNIKKIDQVLHPKLKKQAKQIKPQRPRENDEELAGRFGVWDPAG